MLLSLSYAGVHGVMVMKNQMKQRRQVGHIRLGNQLRHDHSARWLVEQLTFFYIPRRTGPLISSASWLVEQLTFSYITRRTGRLISYV